MKRKRKGKQTKMFVSWKIDDIIDDVRKNIFVFLGTYLNFSKIIKSICQIYENKLI